MQKQVIVSLIGNDRPGLVESLSLTIANLGGSWKDSRLANLAGKFSGIILVEIPEDKLTALENGCLSLKSAGLSIHITSVENNDSIKANDVAISVVANDRPGIVNEISAVFSRYQVNVEELWTHTEPAPMSSESLFHANYHLGVPNDVSIDQLQDALEELADDFMVEISE